MRNILQRAAKTEQNITAEMKISPQCMTQKAPTPSTSITQIQQTDIMAVIFISCTKIWDDQVNRV